MDYERRNFSVSQCIWQDGAPEQISAILSPTYANSTSNSTTSFTPASKPIPAGVIAGATVGGIAVLLLIAGGIAYYIFRCRKRSTSTPSTEDIRLTYFDNKDNKNGSIHDPNSPYPLYKKLGSAGSVHRSDKSSSQPDGELGTQGEIFQMPTNEHNERDYFSAVNRIASERKAANTAQIDGISLAYELHGSEPRPIELDDEKSRQGLSPSTVSPATLSPMTARRPATRGSSRSSSLGPVSDTL